METVMKYIDWSSECNSECCDAPLLNFANDLGICSSCKDWAGIIEQDEEEDE